MLVKGNEGSLERLENIECPGSVGILLLSVSEVDGGFGLYADVVPLRRGCMGIENERLGM